MRLSGAVRTGANEHVRPPPPVPPPARPLAPASFVPRWAHMPQPRTLEISHPTPRHNQASALWA